MTSVERPISQVLGDIVGNVQQIVRAELKLAKAELRDDVVLMKRTAILLAVAAVAGTLALALFSLAAVYALATVLPSWAAALIVAAAILLIAVLCVATARKHMSGVGMPRTAATLQENMQWAKTHVE
jgi:uncharacterized membrane protein YqjE